MSIQNEETSEVTCDMANLLDQLRERFGYVDITSRLRSMLNKAMDIDDNPLEEPRNSEHRVFDVSVNDALDNISRDSPLNHNSTSLKEGTSIDSFQRNTMLSAEDRPGVLPSKGSHSANNKDAVERAVQMEEDESGYLSTLRKRRASPSTQGTQYQQVPSC